MHGRDTLAGMLPVVQVKCTLHWPAYTCTMYLCALQQETARRGGVQRQNGVGISVENGVRLRSLCASFDTVEYQAMCVFLYYVNTI